MRVILVGGLTSVLIGVLVLGGFLVAERRGRSQPPPEEDADQPAPPSPPARGSSRLRRLPAVDAAACAPKARRACWRGRLRLSVAAIEAWRTARAAKQAARMARMRRLLVEARENEGEPEEDDTSSTDELRNEEGDEPRAPRTELVAVNQEDMLPPDASFSRFFEVKAILRDDTPEDLQREEITDDGVSAGDPASSEDDPDATSGRVAPDGAFDLDVAPGRYDIEVSSTDGLLVGGLDALDARAGDARGGVDVALGPAVSIAGRVLDQDGVGAPITVDFHRVHHGEGTVAPGNDTGRFLLPGLRPGIYVVEARTMDGTTTSQQVQAPVVGAELRLRRLPTALLQVPPANDGGCPAGGREGRLSLRRLDGADRRTVYLVGCAAYVPNVPEGSRWRALVLVGGRAIDEIVTFPQGTPMAPVCLGYGCAAGEAGLEVRVVDSEGAPVESATIEVLAGPELGPPVGATIPAFTPGLHEGDRWELRASFGELRVTAAVWLSAGANDVVMRLPGRVAIDQPDSSP